MKTVMVTRAYTDSAGRRNKEGTLLRVSDEEADRLVAEGHAEVRSEPPGPTETKDEEPEEQT